MLRAVLEQERGRVTLDLKDVLIVDREARKTPGIPRIERSRTQKLPDLSP